MGGVAACGEVTKNCTPCSLDATSKGSAQPPLQVGPLPGRGASRAPGPPSAKGARPPSQRGRALQPSPALEPPAPPEQGGGSATAAGPATAGAPGVADVGEAAPQVFGVDAALERPAKQQPRLSEGMKEAMRPVSAGTGTPQRLWDGGLEEPEPAPEVPEAGAPEEPVYSASRERAKSAAAVGLVALHWLVVFGIMAHLSAGFEEPECSGESTVTARCCDPCGKGTNFLPFFGEWERSLSEALRAVLYLTGLAWTFLGIGIVCNQFMGAIEEITSTERVVWRFVRSGAKHKFHLKVWNATVANLTLMALGSSAPEILLSVIEICSSDFFAGALGPSTIVGSAAFNLLVITGVCVSAIPAPETRKVLCTDVFSVTSVFSVLAYIWLLVILQVLSPNRVESWEGVVTLAMFPLLCLLAFAADQGWWRAMLRRSNKPARPRLQGRRDSWVAGEVAKIQEQFGKELPTDTLSLMLQHRSESKSSTSSRAQIRSNLMREVTGALVTARGAGAITVGFDEPEHMVLECAGTLQLKVVASRPPGRSLQVSYYTQEGTAREGVRFLRAEGSLCFLPNQSERAIEVEVIDDDTWQPDEHFTVHLSDLRELGSPRGAGRPELRLGTDKTTVTVLNDDMPGTLAFDVDEVYTHEGLCATLGIVRTHGTCGEISCSYKTIEGTAVAGRDYMHSEGTITFGHGEVTRTVEIRILSSSRHDMESSESFQVALSDASPGVKFESATDREESRAVCDVVIVAEGQPSWLARLARRCVNRDLLAEHLGQWWEQFAAAVCCNGSFEEQAKAGPAEWCVHAVSLVWKLLFAIIPPPGLCGGWLCFIFALGMIGLVTALVSDLAALLGCCMGIPDEITAITLVALGTSLPDTFASKVAAQQDANADNSVGNVTGSNSVNVFLGLGLPWTMAAFYWESLGPTAEWKQHLYKGKSYEELFGAQYPSGGFLVPAGSLAFSVAVFTACALACLGLLVARRLTYGGELGGPRRAQLRDSGILVLLWLLYIVASIVNSVLAQ